MSAYSILSLNFTGWNARVSSLGIRLSDGHIDLLNGSAEEFLAVDCYAYTHTLPLFSLITGLALIAQGAYLTYYPFQPSCVLPAHLYRTLWPMCHPVSLYRYLASVASNATWWLLHMEGDFLTNIWSRSLIIFWSRVNQILSDYHVLFGYLSASVRRVFMLTYNQIAWVSHFLWYHHSIVSTTHLTNDSLWIIVTQ